MQGEEGPATVAKPSSQRLIPLDVLVPPAAEAHTPEATLAGLAVVDAAAASPAPPTIAITHLFTSFPNNHSCLAVRPANALPSQCDPSKVGLRWPTWIVANWRSSQTSR